jgi:N-methylhydantoinase A
VLSWTLTISAPSQERVEAAIKVVTRQLPEPDDFQPLFDPSVQRQVNAPVFLRENLRAGDRLRGPVLITEDQTTTVVTSNYRAEIDARGNIVMTRRENSDD